MDLVFDDKGFLKPYEKIEITLNQFEDFLLNHKHLMIPKQGIKFLIVIEIF